MQGHTRWTGHGGEYGQPCSTGERNGKPLQHSCLEKTMNSMKIQKDKTLKDERPRSVGAQYAKGDEWRNGSRKSEEVEPKQKKCPVVNVSGGESKVQCCKNNTAQEPGRFGPLIKVNWKCSTRRWQA